MEIRKIKPEENILSSMICSIAFVEKEDFSEKLKEPLKYTEGYEDTWAAFDSNGKMISRMSVSPFDMTYDGQIVKMAGIGGVSSLPEERNKGSVRELFKKAMEVMLEQEQIFSFLFPFSHEYYRKFGYEIAYTRRELSIPITCFRFLKNSGTLKFYQLTDNLDDIKDIYNHFIQDKNLMLVRSQKHWETKVQRDPYSKNIYTYTWYNTKGEPKSYMTFESKTDNHERTLSASEFIWADHEGLLGMLGSLPIFYPKYKNFQWYTPSFIPMHSIVHEPYEIKETVTCYGMNRIIDAKKVLERMSYPKEKGSAIIELTDHFLACNNGTYELEWLDGKCNVLKTDHMKNTDITLDIQGLTQLATGFSTPTDVMLSGKAKISSNIENLNHLFPKKDLYVSDYF